MGAHVNGRLMVVAACSVAVLISGLNLFALYQQFLG
jgi:Mn2+/Fe2+ NRAMP family transporter